MVFVQEISSQLAHINHPKIPDRVRKKISKTAELKYRIIES